MAIAVSQAEMPMANKVKKKPSSALGNKKRLNATKLMSTEFKINSMEINTASIFRRVMNPYIPAKNIIVLITR